MTKNYIQPQTRVVFVAGMTLLQSASPAGDMNLNTTIPTDDQW